MNEINFQEESERARNVINELEEELRETKRINKLLNKQIKELLRETFELKRQLRGWKKEKWKNN